MTNFLGHTDFEKPMGHQVAELMGGHGEYNLERILEGGMENINI